MVDDSHAVGFMGEHGRGTPEYCGVMGRVDIITGTFGKALGGASGGYTAATQRDRRPAAPAQPPLPVLQHPGPGHLRGDDLQTIDMLSESTALRDKVHENAALLPRGDARSWVSISCPASIPIVPVMLYDPKVANEFARRMLEKGVYVVGFCYPVVPKGTRPRAHADLRGPHEGRPRFRGQVLR